LGKVGGEKQQKGKNIGTHIGMPRSKEKKRISERPNKANQRTRFALLVRKVNEKKLAPREKTKGRGGEGHGGGGEKA